MRKIIKKVLTENNNTSINNAVLKWLDRYYGKDPKMVKFDGGYFHLTCDPFMYYQPDEGEDTEQYAFAYLSTSKSLTIYWEVRKEIETYFNIDIETIKRLIGIWFFNKFGVKVTWYGWWS